MKIRMFIMVFLVAAVLIGSACSKEEREVLDCVYRGDCDDFETDSTVFPASETESLSQAEAVKNH